MLRRNFEYTLEVLKNDRDRRVSSAVDDLRSWLARGGVSRVKEHLNNQMDARCFPTEKKLDVNKFLDHLVQENRNRLLDLVAAGIVKATQQEWLSVCGLTDLEFNNLLNQILRGQKPFEDWMHAHGHTDVEIEKLYCLSDNWLIHSGIVMSPPSGSVMN